MNEEIFIEGLNSELITSDINMFSNGYIRVNNKDGNFNLKGKGSTLSNDTFIIKGSDITGIFETINTKKDINLLNVLDDKLSYFKNNNNYHHSYWFPPVEGRMLIFPSHLEHDVRENLSNEDRISVSFNIKLEVQE